MAHVIADKGTRDTPQEFIGALMGYSDRRLKLWPKIHRNYDNVHQMSGFRARYARRFGRGAPDGGDECHENQG